MPKVSICIPTYNQVEYLKKCIQSVLMQDYTDYEIIISDDSSNEAVKNYVDSLKNSSIQYYRNSPALGTPSNWNSAISKANGEYIKILHHDDFFTEPDSLKQFVIGLDKNPNSDFAFSSTLVWYVKSDTKRIHSCNIKSLEEIKSNPEYLFFGNSIGSPSATIYRKNLNIEFDVNFKWLVDVDFYITALKKNSEIVYLDAPLICTAHGAEGQVTQQVEYDKTIQIKEHVLLLGKNIENTRLKKMFLLFFDELFLQYDINSIMDVENYVHIPSNLNSFLNEVFSKLNTFRIYKKVKYRLLNSKYNKRYFNIRKFKL